jgi:peptide/nickel transport system substrate-binding protein
MKPKKRGQKLAKRWAVFTERAKADSREHIQENLIDRLPNARRVRLLILEWILLIIVIISLALTQAFWYTQSYSVQAFVDGGTYIEATLGQVKSLNPLFASTNSEKVLSRLMFSTLSTVDYSGHVGLGLAASIVPDSTGKVWTVTIKDDLKWSDGQPITLDDVLFTVNLIKDPTINTIYDSNFAGVSIERVEDTLVFALPSSYADFDSTLNVPILPEHILGETPSGQLMEHNFSTNPVTSGAFSFNAMQSVSSDGERIIYLAANPYYYKSKPMLGSFAIHTYPGLDQIVQAVASSEVTATAELSASYRDQFPTELIYEKQTAIASGVFAFLNVTSGLLNNVTVRQAIRQGINIDEIRSVLDYEFPLDYPILESEIELKTYPELPAYNLDAAKQKIAAAGLAGQTLRLATIDTGYFPALAEQFQTQLTELGFSVKVDIYTPSQEFLLNVVQARNYDILLYEVELGADPDPFPYYHSSQASSSGLNLSNYANSLVDDLILGARTSMNPDTRTAKYENFLTRWVDDVPAIGIYQASMVYYFNKNVRTFSEDDRLVYPVDRFGDVEYWAVDRATKNRTP